MRNISRVVYRDLRKNKTSHDPKVKGLSKLPFSRSVQAGLSTYPGPSSTNMDPDDYNVTQMVQDIKDVCTKLNRKSMLFPSINEKVCIDGIISNKKLRIKIYAIQGER